VVAMRQTIGIGISRSMLPGPSVMLDANDPSCFSARDPRLPVKKQSRREVMIAGWKYARFSLYNEVAIYARIDIRDM
jgi:hypothetical protein